MGSILIVDDDESVRMGLCQLLQDRGYSCEEVENGARALEWVLVHEVELVITDNQMPVMGGIGFLKSIRNIPLSNSPKVIFITGNPSEALWKEANQAGAFAILLKPCKTRELLMAVNKALAITRKERQCVLI